MPRPRGAVTTRAPAATAIAVVASREPPSATMTSRINPRASSSDASVMGRLRAASSVGMITESGASELIACQRLCPQIYRPAGKVPNLRPEKMETAALVDRALIDALHRLAPTRKLRADEVVP